MEHAISIVSAIISMLTVPIPCAVLVVLCAAGVPHSNGSRLVSSVWIVRLPVVWRSAPTRLLVLRPRSQYVCVILLTRLVQSSSKFSEIDSHYFCSGRHTHTYIYIWSWRERLTHHLIHQEQKEQQQPQSALHSRYRRLRRHSLRLRRCPRRPRSATMRNWLAA